MKKLIFAILFITISIFLNSLGTLRVESIKELPATHTNLEVRDADGKWAPVLIVKTELRGLGFQNVSRPTKYAAEYMAGDHQYKFYMNDSQRVVKITHSDYEPLEVRLLADFGINVKAQRVYELELAFDKEVVQVPVMISCNQSGAEVFIDSDSVGKTQNKMLTVNVGSGLRTIRIEKDGFATQEIQEEISMTNNSFNFKLNPAMPAAVTITSNPEGATVYIDNLKFGVTPKSSFFDAGTYPITIEKENYETIEELITITEPETQKDYVLSDIRATLTIKTHPAAIVKFNGNSYKGGVENLQISPQILQVIVEMPKAESIERVVSIQPQSSQSLELYPEIQTGTIQVMVIPIDSIIELNGDGGEFYTAIGRKTFFDVPEGTYDLVVSTEGYKTHIEKFRLHVDETVSKQISLEKGSYLQDNMIFVKGGSFRMGSDERKDAKPIHSVTVSDFYIGKYEVTQKEWQEVIEINLSSRENDNLPMKKVSWYDAVEFCNKKSDMEGLTRCYSGIDKNITCNFKASGYRLPTEAEWEYAARGGNESENYKYSGSNKVSDVAWDWDLFSFKVRPVGTKQPNELGIYDMSGNVWEWCWDWYENYFRGSQINPTGPESGSKRVIRGGSWNTHASICRVWARLNEFPENSSSGSGGFRVVRIVK